jgi:hypothetical protein
MLDLSWTNVFMESGMAKKLGSHVNFIKQDNFDRVIPDTDFRDKIQFAYYINDMREFDVNILTSARPVFTGKFTAGTIIQLTNQSWVKSITQRSVAHLS